MSKEIGMSLADFDSSQLTRGKPKWFEALWLIFSLVVVQSRLPWPSCVRKTILVMFGATIGKGFVCRESVYIHFPWKLSIGDNVWLGARTYIHNLEPVSIGSNTSVAHDVFITTGGHDIKQKNFPFKNLSTTVGSSVWLASRCMLLAGANVGDGAVVAAGSVVTKPVPPFQVVGGSPAKVITKRSIEQ